MVRDGICVSNSFYVVFYPILAPIPYFIQIGRKTQKLKIFKNLVGFCCLGYLDEKLLWAFITHSMLFLVHYQPPYQIIIKSDVKHRSWKLSLHSFFFIRTKFIWTSLWLQFPIDFNETPLSRPETLSRLLRRLGPWWDITRHWDIHNQVIICKLVTFWDKKNWDRSIWDRINGNKVNWDSTNKKVISMSITNRHETGKMKEGWLS